jgi:hypothetical protein
MLYIDGSESKPNKALYYNIKTNKNKESNKEISAYNINLFLRELDIKYIDRLFKYNRNNKRTLRVFKLIILNDNNDYFKDKTNIKDLYNNIINIFNFINLKIIKYYFNKIVNINYNTFNNINKYIK